MFGIGFMEICVIAIFALVIFGPQRLPEIMRQAGKFFVHAKRLSNEVKSTFDKVIDEADEAIVQEEKLAQKQKEQNPKVDQPATKAKSDTIS